MSFINLTKCVINTKYIIKIDKILASRPLASRKNTIPSYRIHLDNKNINGMLFFASGGLNTETDIIITDNQEDYDKITNFIMIVDADSDTAVF